jgi:hypothetical protein
MEANTVCTIAVHMKTGFSMRNRLTIEWNSRRSISSTVIFDARWGKTIGMSEEEPLVTNKLKEGGRTSCDKQTERGRKGGVIEIDTTAAETIFMPTVLSAHSTKKLVATGVSFKRKNQGSKAT